MGSQTTDPSDKLAQPVMKGYGGRHWGGNRCLKSAVTVATAAMHQSAVGHVAVVAAVLLMQGAFDKSTLLMQSVHLTCPR